jgi:choline dehydrogenase
VVKGVEVSRGGATDCIFAEHETVLSAGAIGSAKLLLLSGIGPAQELHQLGIRVLADHPHVGKNLQNHTAYRLEFLTSEPITARRYIHPVRGMTELLRYAVARTGILASGASPIGGFFRSSEHAAAPDIQLFAIPAVLGPGPGLIGMLPKAHGYVFCINQGAPASRGSLRLRSQDALTAPAIDPQYLADPADLEATVLAAERMREVASAPSLAAITARETFPGPSVKTRQDWATHIAATAFNHYHVCGTCRMGRAVEDSVTDAHLRVHGFKGLRVADAAVMPLLMNGNTNAAVIMLAERAAEAMIA